MVRRIEALCMNFLFEYPTVCNLSLVWEFYVNWDPRDKDAEVQIMGQVVTFTAHTLNDLLGVIIFSILRKARFQGGHGPLDISHTKGSATYGSTLTMLERQAWTDEITAWMYGLQMLQLWIGRRPATQQKIRAVELDYPLGRHTETMLWICPNFVEPVEDEFP
ncbi:hypothetical protein FXO37_26625 [Capsicum annuum]|nr:hypothetical protein FXO37_26625 [Capsicum annuum]